MHGWTTTGSPSPEGLRKPGLPLLVEASKDPDLSRRIKELHSEPLGVPRTEMAAMVRRDAEIYSRVVKAHNIKVD